MIKAHPSVLIVGTMNPQHYIGVKPLSQEVKSRARIVYMDYPPLMKGQSASYDEALVLSRFVPSLKDLNNAEFVTAWDYIINHNAANGGDRLVTEQRSADCTKLSMIVKIAGLVREAYRAFRTGKSADPVQFVFSMRETVDIATELEYSSDVKDAIRDVVLPKVSDELERRSIETIIANA